MAKLLNNTRIYGTGTVDTQFVVNGLIGVHSTNSGALQVQGGVGIGGNLFVNGVVTATSFVGAISGTVTDISGGTAGQLLYQIGANDTGFAGPGTAGQILVSAGTSAPTYTSTSSIYVNNAVNADTLRGGTTGQLVYQSAANTTAFAGPGTAGQLLVSGGAAAPVYTNTSTIYVNAAVNAQTLFGGTAGQLVYQSGAGVTAFAGPGTAGQVLTSGGTGAPTYVNTGSLYVGRALVADSATGGSATANNLSGGILGQIPYQLGANSTAFIGTGTNGSILVMGANTATFVTTANIYVNNANFAIDLRGGTAGQLVYQVGANDTGFAGPGNAGEILVSAGTSAPTYTNTGSIYVGFANASNNLLAGAGGSIPYQSAANTTAMLSIGGSNSILVSNGSTPSWTTSPTIGGNVTIAGNLTVQGTTVIVDSTVTNISDPIFTIGTAANGGIPVSDDGKDRGIAFVWTGTQAGLNTNRTGFFGFDRSTLYFTFITSASITNEVVAPAGGTTRGAIDANLAGGTAGQLVYQSAADTTAFVGPGTAGQILVSAGASAPVYTSTSSIYVNSAVNAQTLFGGTAGQLVYQSGAGVTAFAGPGTAGQVLTSGGTGAPTYVNTGSLYVGRALVADSASGGSASATNIAGGALGQIPYQLAAGSTAFIGTGTSGSILQMGANTATFVTTANIYVNSSVFAIDLRGGTAGQLVYQVGANDSGFVGPGTAGDILVSAGTSAPTYTGTASIYVAFANSSNNIRAGTAGQVPYQTGANATSFFGPGTAGQILVSAGTSAPTYTSTSSIYVNRATLADNDSGGAAGGLRYQTAANASTFLSIGTANQFLRVNAAANAPEWISTGSMYVSRAVTADSASGNSGSATNIAGGTAGQVPYQTGPGATSFFGPGTAGQILVSAGTSAPTYTSTSSIYVNTAVRGDTLLTVARPNAGLHYLTFVDSHNASATAESFYTTSTFNLDPRTGNVAIGTTATSNKFEVAGSAGQLFSVADTFTGTIFAASDVSGIPSIEVLDTGLVKLAQYGGNVTISTGTNQQGAALTVYGGLLMQGITTSTNTTGVSSTNTGALRLLGGLGVWGGGFFGSTVTATNVYISTALGVGTAPSTTAGEIRASNEITAYYSDRRLKENVQVIDDALVKVLSLHGITYNANDIAESFGYDKSKRLVGVFADEIEAVLPEAVRPAPFDIDENGKSKSGENYRTVQYEKIVPLLIEAIKEQHKEIDKLKEEIKEIRKSL